MMYLWQCLHVHVLAVAGSSIAMPQSGLQPADTPFGKAHMCPPTHPLTSPLHPPCGRCAAAFFLVVCYTAYLFYQEDEGAGLLMLPYVAWVAFANLLNIGFVKKNTGV
jgi:hypothetical protein